MSVQPVQCNVCGTWVTPAFSAPPVCPRCGNGSQPRKEGGGCWTAIVGLAILGCIGGGGLTVMLALAPDPEPVATQPAFDPDPCGSRPPVLSPWDRGIIGAEEYIGRSAHDPDSVDVEACSPPVRTPDNCWRTDCSVRAKNAFGALVLQRMRFFVGRDDEILGAVPFPE